MTRFLLLLHAVASVFLLGAATHQAFAACWPGRAEGHGFTNAFRKVPGRSFAAPTLFLFLATAALGAWLYPAFRVDVRAAVLDVQYPWATSLFELKEHFAAIGLCLLPAYWSLWSRKEEDHDASSRAARGALTALLAFACWWSFAVGHVLNNIKGL
jgi:hypothetical protein